ncbi:MAG TPA: RraA family protein [Vicinamibacterales bacterium]
MTEPLSSALVEELRHLDSCVISNAIETFNVRLRNEGFSNADIRCVFDDLPPVIGCAVTATIRSATPPPVGQVYADRTDWWNYVATVPAPRIVVVHDQDERPGVGAFLGEVHANILRALGCVAYVTNGAVRDLPGVRRAELQAFAGNVSPSHAFVHIVGFGEPVEVAGLKVASGDLLFGDRHGIVAIPGEIASQIPSTVAAMRQRDRRIVEFCRSRDFDIAALRSIVQDWDS